MIIKVLVENSCVASQLKAQHGLSLFIDSGGRKILFDLGQGAMFMENAQVLGVPIEEVEVLVISHGHYDHGGGLAVFLQHNKKARIFIQRQAFSRLWSQDSKGVMHDIGLDDSLAHNQRLIFVDDYLRIDHELEIFAAVKGRELFSPANNSLLQGPAPSREKDNFEHEQNLIINTAAGGVLLAGCAHNGAINILEHYRELKGAYPQAMIGGFHLMGPAHLQADLDQLTRQLGNRLLRYPTRFYTNHCTGPRAFALLQDILPIQYLAGGASLEL